MAIPKEDLKQIGDLMDKRLMIFTEKVIIPAVERITNDLKKELKDEIREVGNDVARVERKLDNITTHHAQKLDAHEKKLNQIFA